MDKIVCELSTRQGVDMDSQKIPSPSNHGKYRRPYGVHLSRIRDMPAHLKASLLGPSLSIPVTEGRLAMGTWQGIYLCEHRDHGGPRQLVLTLNGERTRWRPEQAMPDPYRRRN